MGLSPEMNERINAKRRALLVLSIALQVTAAVLFVAAAGSMLLDRFREGIDAGGERLVYHTDNAAVARACQLVLADPKAAGFPPATNGVSQVSGFQFGDVPPAALPAVLRNLNFEVMNVEATQITILFGGGFGHWGYSTTTPQGDQLQVAPGLWFWSDFGLPPDLSKFPYYRTGKRFLMAGLISTAAALLLLVYRSRRFNLEMIKLNGT